MSGSDKKLARKLHREAEEKDNLKRSFKPESCPDCVALKKRVKKLEGMVSNLLMQNKVIPEEPIKDDPGMREVELDMGEPVLAVGAVRYGEG